MDGQAAEERFLHSLEEARLAKQFVCDLYNQRRPAGVPDANSRSLAKALKLLSSELYTKRTHFILELIQNADDAEYLPGVEPTLSFVLRADGWLWVGSNEVGFTKDNVMAICDINGSTKTIQDHQKGYIGEKGIGFKSCFTVADRVWISSQPYNFRLGRNDLEMISPVVEDFKHTSMLQEQTMFCLHIPQKEDLANVRKEMHTLKPELLLFLRKLRKIRVVMAEKESQIEHEFLLHRQDDVDDLQSCGYTTTQLARSDLAPLPKFTTDQLVVFRHTTQSMPEEAKREGIKHSEIVLAFPLDGNISSRPVYNFLPIANYGFPFLLHADFITTVNRESINHHNNWNMALVSATIDMFIQCINAFNKIQTVQMQALRYQWPSLIAAKYAKGTIMKDFFDGLVGRLKEERVLLTWSGQLARPSSLIILPERWLDHNTPALPLFAEPQHLRLYASSDYGPEISRLGPGEESGSYFADLLKKLPPAKLQQQSQEWHSMIAAAMLVAPPVAPTCLHGIKMIPLRGGSWASSAGGSHAIYFPDTSNNVHVPDGIEVRIVASSAAADPDRRSLFRKLGVQDLDTRQVCNLILERHAKLASPTSELDVDTLVHHIQYLYMYRENFDDKRLKGLKLAVDDGEFAVNGNELYMDAIDEGHFQMSEHFKRSETCNFIHKRYLLDPLDPNRSFWDSWLRRKFNVRTKPPLVIQQGVISPLAAMHDLAKRTYTIHPLFQQLLDRPDSSVWLNLLKDKWSYYEDGFHKLPKNHLSKTLVHCTNGQQGPLNEVYLATADVTKERLAFFGVKLLEVKHQGKTWRESDYAFLDKFDANRKADINFFVCILRKAAKGDFSTHPPGFTFADVMRLMKAIQDLKTENNWAEIRKPFKTEKLIAIIKDNSLSWVSLEQCMWQAPECFTGVVSLAKLYNDVQELFTGPLEVYDVSASAIAEKLDAVEGQIEEIEGIKALLMALSTRLATSRDTLDYLESYRRIRIFPVQRPDGGLDLVTADDDTWFIADDRRLENCFKGKVAILDYAFHELPHLVPLLRLLGIVQKKLSSSVSEMRVIPEGRSKPLPPLAEELQSKAEYLSLLVPHQEKNDVQVKLQSMEVYVSRGTILRRYLQIGSDNIYGKDVAEQAYICELKGSFQLHCRASAMKHKQPPWCRICESIFRKFNIPDEHRETLALILQTPAGPLTHDILRCKGLWDEDPSDIDDLDEEEEQETVIYQRETLANNDGQHEVGMHEGNAESDDGRSDSPNSRASSEDSCDAPPTTDNESRSLSAFPSSELEIPQPTQRPPQTRRTGHSRQTDPSSTDARARNKAQRDQDALDAIAAAASTYNIEVVKIHAPTPNARNPTKSLAGLAFEDVKPSEYFIDPKHDVPYKGEIFVQALLKNMFKCSDDSWTSNMRERQGLESLADPNDYSTFTVDNQHEVGLITAWLIRRGCDPRDPDSEYLETALTYHIYVKATDGDFDEPFSMSNQEIRLAKEWSDSESEIILVLRVYDLNVVHPRASHLAPQTFPKFRVLVDPVRLLLAGKSAITAVNGYTMSLA